MNSWNLGVLDCSTFWFLDSRLTILRILDLWILGFLNFWILGFSDIWIVWTPGLSDSWILGYLDFWFSDFRFLKLLGFWRLLTCLEFWFLGFFYSCIFRIINSWMTVSALSWIPGYSDSLILKSLILTFLHSRALGFLDS